MFAKGRDGKPKVRTWAANPELFPCELTTGTVDMAKKAIKVRPWEIHGGACKLCAKFDCLGGLLRVHGE